MMATLGLLSSRAMLGTYNLPPAQLISNAKMCQKRKSIL
jgi:hypothetical protein